MSTQELETLLAIFASRPQAENPTVADMRAAMQQLADFLPPPAAAVESATIGGVPGERIVPDGADAARCLLYLHGGGYVIGGPHTHRKLAADLAAAIGCPAVLPDYRLAPEHPFPAGLEDAVAVYDALIAEGIAPANIAVAGDSAGGGLTVALLLKLKALGRPLPAAAVCISPWTDMEGTGASIAGKADADPMVKAEGLHGFAGLYVGDGDKRDPLVSPIHGDLGGLPPLLIQVGEAEILLDDALRLAGRAGADGIDVSYRVWPKMFHVWHIFAHMLSEGRDAIDEAGAFMRARLAA